MNLEHLQIALDRQRKARAKWSPLRRAFYRGFRKAFRADILGVTVAIALLINLAAQ